MLFKGNSFKIQIQDGSKEFNEEARKNKLPIIDFTACEKKIKDLGLIPMNEKVYAVNTILDSSLLFEQDFDALSTSKGITTKLVNSKAEEIDTSKCDSFIIKMPINNNLIDVSGQEEILLQNGVDVFNSTNEAFSDKCTSFPSKNGTDLTLNSRRTKFDKAALCSEGTEYIGVDEHQYAICEAKNLPKEAVSKFEEAVFDALKNDNYLLFLCYSNSIKNITKNIAFWGFSSCSLLFSAAAVLHVMFFSVKTNLPKIHDHDAITFLKKGESGFSSGPPSSSGSVFPISNNIKIKSEKVIYDKISSNSNISVTKYMIKPKLIGNDNDINNLNDRNINETYLNAENMDISINEMDNNRENSPNSLTNNRTNMYSTNNFIAGNDNSELHLDKNKNKPEIKYNNDKNSIYHNDYNYNSNSNLQENVRLGLNLGDDNTTFNNNSNHDVINVNSNNNYSNLNNSPNENNNNSNVNNNGNNANKNEQISYDVSKDPALIDDKVIFKTKADIESLPFAYRVRYDERGFWEYLWNDFKHRQEFLNLIFIVSIKDPFMIRVFRAMFLISLEFAFNSYFYQDSNVEKQAEYIEKNGPGSVGIGYIILNELMQSFACVAASVIITSIINLIIIIPASTEEVLNQKLTSDNEEIKEEGINEFKSKMKFRYIIWIVCTFTIHIVCWYFAICFCSVFVNSNKSWLYKGLLSLAIGFLGIKVFVSLFLTTFRTIVKCYPFM